MAVTSLLRPAKILVDTNVWIRYLLGDEGTNSEVKKLFELCNSRDIDLYYCPSSLKDIFYLVPRILRREAGADGVRGEADDVSYRPAAWACVRAVQDLAFAAPLTGPECELSWMLRGNHPDLEDNLIVAAAEACGADYVATYDEGLIAHFAPACVTPGELNALLLAASVDDASE